MPFDILQTGLDPATRSLVPVDRLHDARGRAAGAIRGGERNDRRCRRTNQWTGSPGAQLAFDKGRGALCLIHFADSRSAATDVPVVTLALGLAAADAITRTCGVACDLRWPNDVLIQDKDKAKKCCGILTQLHSQAIVAGIGINVNHAHFPDEISQLATSLRIATGREQSRELGCSEIWHRQWRALPGFW